MPFHLLFVHVRMCMTVRVTMRVAVPVIVPVAVSVAMVMMTASRVHAPEVDSQADRRHE